MPNSMPRHLGIINTNNTTWSGGFTPYQNTNFIEALFRHVMNHGWEGLGIMFIIQLYLFLSLDHIKDGFKYVNDKIALHGRNKLESYCGLVSQGAHNVWNLVKALFLDWIAALPLWLARKWRRVVPAPPVDNKKPSSKPKPQKHTLKLDPTNSIDIMSLCNYILNNKKSLKLQPRSDRIASTKKTTSEVYTLPNSLLLGRVGDIKVSLSQHIGLKLESESDHVTEKVKKYMYDKEYMSSNKPKAGRNFTALKEVLKKLWGDKPIYFDDPPFWFQKEEWSCDPESMSNNEFTDLWRVLYYLGDINIIRKFVLYLTGQEPFRFDGRTFEKGSSDKIDDFQDAFSNRATMESFLAEVPAYHEQFLKKLEEQGTKAHIDEMAKKFLNKYQSGKGDSNTRIAINFSSKSFTEHQLSKFGRQWFSKQIHAYYDQSMKKTGEKVNIYKLFINYDTHTVEMPNPKYDEWQKQQEEERKRREQGDDSETSKKSDTKATTETKTASHAAPSATNNDNTPATTGADSATASTSAPAPATATATAAAADPPVKEQEGEADAQAAAETRTQAESQPDKPAKKKSKSKRQKQAAAAAAAAARAVAEAQAESSSSSDSDSDWDDDEIVAANYFNLFDSGPEDYGREYGHAHGPGPEVWYGGQHHYGASSHGKKSRRKKKKHGGKGNYGYWNGYHHQQTSYKPAPSKTIKVEKKIPSAQAKLIKSDRKPLEYLYLPDDKMQSIVQYLRNFRERRDRFEQYGFPYRGGIILSGVPGCGKSSTILATATYLQKDIYYLDLGQIKTNHELKLCVDYIRTNSSNGGVIIFEDIDCMTHIVHQRSDSLESVEMTTKTNITTIADEDDCPLSLSYLLNVLDGTMAPEDVIFIMTTNHVEKLDKALIRPGRIDLDIELTKCTRIQLAKIYNDLYNKDLHPDILEAFPEKHWIIAKVILHLFHNSFDPNIDQWELVRPLLNTDEDELGKLGDWE